MKINGTVASGFESVRALYEKNMHALVERNTQLCVYVDGQCVVDLWASAIGDEDFGPDSLINVFSSGKSLEAITMAMLADKGLIDYDAKISEYWPEYAQNGKDQTIADLMRHEAGLAALDTTIDPNDLHPDRLKENAVGEIIARQTARFREGENEQREYHAVTRGWIANEVFRRVEPKGRTMGEFLREEISEPLGTDVYIGLKDEELARVNPVKMLGFGYQFGQGLIPNFAGRKMESNVFQTAAKLWSLRDAMSKRTHKRPPVPIAGMEKMSVVNEAAMSKGETPSAGAKCSARGLAKIAAVMANGGSLDNYQIMSPEAHEALHDKPIDRPMLALDTGFTQGGLALFSKRDASASPFSRGLNNGREGFYGWMGLGGSIFQWHPEKNIGFAYAPTSLNFLDLANERGKAYQSEVLRCV